jgi:hypothetical protein
VDVLSVTSGASGSTVFHNHHHWVTVTGDTITLADADASAYPTPIQGLFAISYIHGVEVTVALGYSRAPREH